MEQANALVPRLVAQYPRRFAKPAVQPRDAHRGFNGSQQELGWICSEQYERTLSKSLSCSFREQLLQVQTPGSAGYHLRGAKVTVCEDSNGAGLTLLHKGKPLTFKRPSGAMSWTIDRPTTRRWSCASSSSGAGP